MHKNKAKSSIYDIKYKAYGQFGYAPFLVSKHAMKKILYFLKNFAKRVDFSLQIEYNLSTVNGMKLEVTIKMLVLVENFNGQMSRKI